MHFTQLIGRGKRFYFLLIYCKKITKNQFSVENLNCGIKDLDLDLDLDTNLELLELRCCVTIIGSGGSILGCKVSDPDPDSLHLAGSG